MATRFPSTREQPSNRGKLVPPAGGGGNPLRDTPGRVAPLGGGNKPKNTKMGGGGGGLPYGRKELAELQRQANISNTRPESGAAMSSSDRGHIQELQKARLANTQFRKQQMMNQAARRAVKQAGGGGGGGGGVGTGNPPTGGAGPAVAPGPGVVQPTPAADPAAAAAAGGPQAGPTGMNAAGGDITGGGDPAIMAAIQQAQAQRQQMMQQRAGMFSDARRFPGGYRGGGDAFGNAGGGMPMDDGAAIRAATRQVMPARGMPPGGVAGGGAPMGGAPEAAGAPGADPAIMSAIQQAQATPALDRAGMMQRRAVKPYQRWRRPMMQRPAMAPPGGAGVAAPAAPGAPPGGTAATGTLAANPALIQSIGNVL